MALRTPSADSHTHDQRHMACERHQAEVAPFVAQTQFADWSGSIMHRRAHADRFYEFPPEVGYRIEKEDDRNTYLMIEAKDIELCGLKSPILRRRRGWVNVDETPDHGRAIGAWRMRKSKKAKAQDVGDENQAASKSHQRKKAKRSTTICGAEAKATVDMPSKAQDASLIQCEDLAPFLNQQEVPQTVDGAPIAVGESEEQPEVAAAAQEDGGGCGVARKRKVAKSRTTLGKRVF